MTGTTARSVCGCAEDGAMATAGKGAEAASVRAGALAGADGAVDGPISMMDAKGGICRKLTRAEAARCDREHEPVRLP